MLRTRFDFTGRRVFVSGSTSGIGAATARLFAESGAQVVIHGRNAERASALYEEIRSRGGQAIVALGAIGDGAATDAIVEQVVSQVGAIDVLVCNAADHQPYTTDWMSVPAEAWVSTYERNMVGSLRFIQAFVPAMREQSWGRVVLVGSSAYFSPTPKFPTYGPSKAALVNMMINLAAELANTGVTVNTVSPGSVLTETMRSNLLAMAAGEGWDETDLGVIERRLIAEKWPNAVGRMGRPEEIAATIAFAASDEAGYMSGSNIRVNGGESLSFH
jgi:3-oxoacyl-[acyl-carrier protein] reductase